MRRQRIDALPKKFGGKWGWRGWRGPVLEENHAGLAGRRLALYAWSWSRHLATYPDGRKETLLLVPHYNFNGQITYRMEEPKFIPKGTGMAIISHFDNSPNNPLTPDPAKVVRWGEASEMEMMDGWIEYLDAPRGGTAQPQ